LITDTNVNLSRWPFRRLAGDEPEALVAKLRSREVTRAWAGTYDGLLHRDISQANVRLAADCRTYGNGLLVPFGSINPMLPDWQEDVRRCARDHRMPGIRLHPNYHGYKLTDPVFAEVLDAARASGLLVQIAVSMEDIRTQHPLMRAPPVDVTALPQLLGARSSAKVMLLNWAPVLKRDELRPFAEAGIYFDIATVEGVEGVARLVDEVSAERVLFGSNFPFFYLESALLKMDESGLADAKKTLIREGNARRILSWPAR
jgi:uncharacterized protein